MPNTRTKRGEQGAVAPVTVLLEVDPFITTMNLEKLRALVIGGADPAVATAEYDGASADFDDVAVELATPSLFSPTKFVVVRNADKLISGQGDKVLVYLKQPPPGAYLALVTGTLDQRRKAGKALAAGARVIRCDRVAAREIPSWAIARAKHYGKRLDRQALALLVSIAGDEVSRLDAELAKLAIYVGSRQVIAADDVQALAVGSHSFKPWDLTDAIGAGDRKKALAVAQSMLEEGANEIVFVAMLARYVEDLIAAVTDPGRLERIPSRFVRDKLAQQARNFSLEKLKRLFAHVHDADAELKSSPIDSRVTVEALVARLAS